jgi:hypothetical protein
MDEVADTDTADGERWRRCYERLQEIRAYEFDWNDEGANPPGLEVTGLAEAVLLNLQTNNQRPPDSFFATDEGHVILSWEKEGHYFEIEVDAMLQCTGRSIPPSALRAASNKIHQSDLAQISIPIHYSI